MVTTIEDKKECYLKQKLNNINFINVHVFEMSLDNEESTQWNRNLRFTLTSTSPTEVCSWAFCIDGQLEFVIKSYMLWKCKIWYGL